MTKIYSMKNKHPERQPQKAISSGCSFQRYFSSSLLLVIHKRLVLTPASCYVFSHISQASYFYCLTYILAIQSEKLHQNQKFYYLSPTNLIAIVCQLSNQGKNDSQNSVYKWSILICRQSAATNRKCRITKCTIERNQIARQQIPYL